MSKVIHSTDSNFETEVLSSDVPVFVDFWASWCAPCRMITPFVEQIAKEYDGKLKVVKVNVDECPNVSSAHKVSSIPSLMMFKGGKVVSAMTGALPLAQMKAFVEEQI